MFYKDMVNEYFVIKTLKELLSNIYIFILCTMHINTNIITTCVLLVFVFCLKNRPNFSTLQFEVIIFSSYIF